MATFNFGEQRSFQFPLEDVFESEKKIRKEEVQKVKPVKKKKI